MGDRTENLNLYKPEVAVDKFRTDFLAGFSANMETLDTAIGALQDVAIVEMGSNASGTYVRWANGMQLCWVIVSSDDDVAPGEFRNVDGLKGSHAASFTDDPVILFLPRLSSAPLIGRIYNDRFYATDPSTGFSVGGRNFHSASISVTINVFAIGSWK